MADELYVCGLPENSSLGKAQCIVTDAYKNKKGTIWLKLLKHQEGNNFIPLTRLFSRDEVEPLSKENGRRLRKIVDSEVRVCINPLTHAKDLTDLKDGSPFFYRETLNGEHHKYRDIHTGEFFELRNPGYLEKEIEYFERVE